MGMTNNVERQHYGSGHRYLLAIILCMVNVVYIAIIMGIDRDVKRAFKMCMTRGVCIASIMGMATAV
jgi:hypothetical protein